MVPMLDVIGRVEAGITCPCCGGPATIHEYWSTSPENRGVRTLKRQTCCDSRPKRNPRAGWGRKREGCPVTVEVVSEERLAEPAREPAQEMERIMSYESVPNGVVPHPLIISPTVEPKEEPSSGNLRGRLSVEERERIHQLHTQGQSLEQIAQQVSRSVKVVHKVLDSANSPMQDSEEEDNQAESLSKIDMLLNLLCEIPEESVEDLLTLARLRRQEEDLRRRLVQALTSSPRPGSPKP